MANAARPNIPIKMAPEIAPAKRARSILLRVSIIESPRNYPRSTWKISVDRLGGTWTSRRNRHQAFNIDSERWLAQTIPFDWINVLNNNEHYFEVSWLLLQYAMLKATNPIPFVAANISVVVLPQEITNSFVKIPRVPIANKTKASFPTCSFISSSPMNKVY